ncbi:MAG: hypothetical protein J07HQW1_02501 [Haloquadratum walsbyi J07HQW1]|uniref:Uncharacterized protein n=1 Tax=Haloquadratum walsbyi J07HQW1 TaxID=1238424 RepID=U1PFR2_9EURY|nr:MAG: hypothetical protein J07HQW1_02501 [Haloquadratum walsbyi J07HQW1]
MGLRRLYTTVSTPFRCFLSVQFQLNAVCAGQLTFVFKRCNEVCCILVGLNIRLEAYCRKFSTGKKESASGLDPEVLHSVNLVYSFAICENLSVRCRDWIPPSAVKSLCCDTEGRGCLITLEL